MRFLLLISLLSGASATFADTHQRKHDAHQHGHAELKFAWSNGNLDIELDTPAMNLTGFEHQAVNAKDKQTLQHVVQQLKQANQLLSLDIAAECKLQPVNIESSLINHQPNHSDEEMAHNDQHEDHDDHNDQHEDHDDHNDHNDQHENHDDQHEDHNDQHEDHNDQHNDHDEPTSEHADFEVSIQYHCNKTSQLKYIDMSGLFEAFNGIEELDVEWVTDLKQGAVELNPSNTRINLR